MLVAKFENGTSLPYLQAQETEEKWNGSTRRMLTLTCTSDAMPVDALNILMSDTAQTNEITLENTEEGVQNVYSGYVLKLEVGVKRTLTQAETPETAARYADRLVCRLGRRTYIEEQLARLGL